jgi:hypothetical protein
MLNVGLKKIKGRWYVYSEGYLRGEKITKACGSIFEPNAWVTCFKACSESGTARRQFFKQLTRFVFLKLSAEEASEILKKFAQEASKREPSAGEVTVTEFVSKLKYPLRRLLLHNIFATMIRNGCNVSAKDILEMPLSVVKGVESFQEIKITFWQIIFEQKGFPQQTLDIEEPCPTPLTAPLPKCGVCGNPLSVDELFDVLNTFAHYQTLIPASLILEGVAFCNKCKRSYRFKAEVKARQPMQQLLEVYENVFTVKDFCDKIESEV